MKALATYSIKGGVGKTTAAVNLAAEAARSGARVLLWDLDPQGAATFFMRVAPEFKGGVERLLDRGSLARYIRATEDPAVHLVPADFSLRHLDLRLDDAGKPTRRIAALLKSVATDYDVAIIDCPAGITLTSESVFAAVAVLVVPTIPTTLSQRTLDQLRDHLATGDARPQVLAFASMFDRRKKLQRQILADLAADTDGFLPTAIPSVSVIEQMGLERAPVAVYAPTNAATFAFRALWSDIAARIWV